MENFQNKIKLPINEFRTFGGPILDVRSPSEFQKGHIPGAINLALFDDKERAQIGSIYKGTGKEAAIELGFQYVYPKLRDLLKKGSKLSNDGRIRIHCARGGLRSRSLAAKFDEEKIETAVLDGGYKAYRNWALTEVSKPREIIVLTGLTGAGKTEILRRFAKQGEQVLDLEGLANHRGSVFGAIGMQPQPTSQQFQNMIAEELSKFKPNQRIWIEAESAQIGNCWVPESLIKQIRKAPAVEVTRPINERIEYLIETYSCEGTSELIEAVSRLYKQLGGKRTNEVLEDLKRGNLRKATEKILEYYDRAYQKHRRRQGKCVATLNHKADIGKFLKNQTTK
ncbi:MAG: tRNA 2-selenouridine(34) synthase MnmH [Pyrinomonadaceae bacterium]